MDVDKDYSGQNIGKYSLIEKLGKGHFGAVYSANDMVLNTKKAIKIMNIDNPSKAQKLFEEAAIPYKCKHNNIVTINGGSLELFNKDLHFVIDMELIDGGSLEDAIRTHKLSVLESLAIIKSVLFGLQHSHNQGIIHRDIKPANILIANQIPKLSDFGLATALNSILPTSPWYLTHAAPEIKDTFTATIETDIYAIGLTLFRSVNGITNWLTYLNSINNIEKIIENGSLAEKAKYESFIPQKVIRIIRKACKPNPENRYHSAAEMRNAIEKLMPLFNWHQTNKCEWQGVTNTQVQNILIIQKRNGFEVQVKINGRKNAANTKLFSNQIEAKKYMNTYISNTTIK